MAATDFFSKDAVPGKNLQLGDFQFKIEKEIYSGPFSQVYMISIPKSKTPLVLKISKEEKFMKREIFVLKSLKQVHGFPKLYFAGQFDEYSFSVMNLFGKSLQHYLDMSPKRRFTIGTSLRIAVQTLERLKKLHEFGVLHRDIKPDNFVVGLTKSHIVYAIDLGFCRPFRNKDNTIKAPRKRGPLVGTDFYGSLAANLADDQAPKDDLESWFYMVLYIASSFLPWKGLNRRQVIDYKIAVRKRPELLVNGSNAFLEIFHILINTRFQDEPNYARIQHILFELMEENNIKPTSKLDWKMELNQLI